MTAALVGAPAPPIIAVLCMFIRHE